uniref:Leucine rich repeat containing 24 n=1 Tax=Hippocampus comes TaxID=109280 RepID=A0A3Q2XPT3_HIPCM
MPPPLPPAVRLLFLLLIILLVLPHAAAVGVTAPCPASCRCYSLTVECGSTGLLALPERVPASTQTLFLQDNVIGQIRRQDLHPLAQLHYLYLESCSVEGEYFPSKRHSSLLLFRGPQTSCCRLAMRRPQRLQELHLQRNGVEMVGEQAMAGLTSLALLDLSGNRLHTLAAAALRPLVSLQVLRITENPWRCDCALHWLRTWMDEEGRRLLSSSERRRLRCREPPRLSRLGLLEVPPNSLVCIPPLVQLEPRRMAVRLGDSLRVSCHASGYPRPQVTWRKPSEGGGARVQKSDEGASHFDPDTGSGMLFLSNVTVAHAGFYECEAWNAGGAARLTFQLAINSSSSSVWAGWAQAPSPDSPAWPQSEDRNENVALAVLAHQEESILYVNDYSDGPTTFAQLEEFRDERGHEMFVLNRAKPVPAPAPPAGEGVFVNHAGLFVDSRMGYEIHC